MREGGQLLGLEAVYGQSMDDIHFLCRHCSKVQRTSRVVRTSILFTFVRLSAWPRLSSRLASTCKRLEGHARLALLAQTLIPVMSIPVTPSRVGKPGPDPAK